jgi:hypothetical protein
MDCSSAASPGLGFECKARYGIHPAVYLVQMHCHYNFSPLHNLPSLQRKKTESGNEKKSKFFGEYWSQEPSSGSDEGDDDAPDLAVTPGRALEGLVSSPAYPLPHWFLKPHQHSPCVRVMPMQTCAKRVSCPNQIKKHGERPMTVGRPSIIGQRTLSGRKLDDNADNKRMHQKPASPKGRAASGGRVISSEESEDDMPSPEKSGLLHTLVPNNRGGLKQVSSKVGPTRNPTPYPTSTPTPTPVSVLSCPALPYQITPCRILRHPSFTQATSVHEIEPH